MDAAVDGARRRPAAAAGRRPGHPAPGRDLAAGVRLHRAGDHRRGRLRQGAAHGAGRAGRGRARQAAGAAGRLDHRLHQPGRHRHPRAAGRGPSCHRAVQRRDRLPAAVRLPAGRHARAGRARSRRSQSSDLGTGRLPRRPGHAARPAGAPRRGNRGPHRPAARGDAAGRRRGAVLLPALFLGPRRRGGGRARPADQGGGRGRDRAAAAGDVRRPGAGHQARAADSPGRRVLLRGRGRAARLAGRRRRGPPGGERAQPRNAAVPG